MNDMLNYLLRSALCLALLYLPCRWVVRRSTHIVAGRAALMASAVGAVVVPLLPALWFREPTTFEIMASIQTAEMLPLLSDAEPAGGNWSFSALLSALYIVGLLAVVVRYAYAGWRMHVATRSGCLWHDRIDGITVYCHTDDIAPFSWMRSVVIGQRDGSDMASPVLLHELAHVRHHHWLDNLVLAVVCSVQWFNPLAWLLARDVHRQHEYEADRDVISQGIDATQYQQLLIARAAGWPERYALAGGFAQSDLKQRILMIQSFKSGPLSVWRYLLLTPVAALSVSLFASPPDLAMPHFSAAYGATADSQTRVVVAEADVPPEFPGGEQALLDYLSTNLHYPSTAIEQKVEGRVDVKFVILKDGMVSDAVIVNKVHPDLDAEALRVVKAMPRWKPAMSGGEAVGISYVLPIFFRLPNGDGEPSVAVDTQNAKKIMDVPGRETEPLILVDGEVTTKEALMGLDPSRIAMMTVLKDEASTAPYGKAGKMGVLLITLKQ